MKILKIIISNFGKFKNKTIEFKEGLNIVYGENEAGKSTIHKFIEGMLFGFYKPYTKKKIYTKDYQKYLPWNSNKYNGILIYEHEGKRYRIERNFVKKREDVKIYDDVSGEDITYLFEYDPIIRLYKPIFNNLGLNSIIYKNTISIAQLSNRTGKDLAKEVKDSLINLGGSKDQDISVKRVIDKLDSKIQDIGTSGRKKTSPYGKIIGEIELLELEKERSLKNMELIKQSQRKYNELLDELKILENQKNKIELDILLYDEYKKYEQFKEINKYKKEIGKINNKLDDLEYLKDISMKDIDETISNFYLLEKYLKDKNDTELEIELVKNNIRINDIGSIKYIEKDYYSYEDLEQKIQKIQEVIFNEDDKQINLENEKNTLSNKNKTNKMILSILGIAILISIILGICIKPIYSIIGMLTFVGIVYTYRKLNKTKTKLSNLDKEIKNIKIIITEKEKQKNKIQEEMKNILNKYKCNFKEELIKIKIEFTHKIALHDEYENTINKLKKQFSKINDEIEIIRNKISNLNIDIKNIKQLKDLKDQKLIYEKLNNELKMKNEILSKLLSDNDYNNFESKFEKIDLNKFDKIRDFNKPEALEKIDKFNLDILSMSKEISKIEEHINYLFIKEKPLVDVLQDIQDKNYLKEKYEFELQAINIAKSTIETISKNIQNEFAPKLNDKVTDIVKRTTGDRYNSIKVLKNMDMKIVEPSTNKLVDIEQLSSGTIDQMYFALRMGIIDIINDNVELPLILDDCFVQYDDNRLRNMLKSLIKYYNNRQIIIFTCQKREKDLLNKMNEEFNNIQLNL